MPVLAAIDAREWGCSPLGQRPVQTSQKVIERYKDMALRLGFHNCLQYDWGVLLG